MINLIPQFAAESSSGGLGAFHVNVKTFLFQLITFVIILAMLRRWVLPKLVATMDERQKTLEKSLTDAKKTEEALANAQTKSEEILAKAREAADQSIADAKKAARDVIAQAETAAGTRAALIVKEAEARLDQERDKLRQELRKELAQLVAIATEKIIDEKMDDKQDMTLIERVIKGVAH